MAFVRQQIAIGEFLLPYDSGVALIDPEAALMAFLENTYSAAADLGGRGRGALECAIGVPRRRRSI